MRGLSITADPELAAAGRKLRDALERAGDALDAESFKRLLAPLAKNLLQGAFDRAGADHGAIWLTDEDGEHLVPLFGVGERAAEFASGQFRLPIGQGMLSMVFATAQPICENAVHENPTHNAALDQKLGVRTEAMIAIPLTFAGRLRGIVSCVHLAPAESEELARSFSGADLTELELAAAAIARLFDLELTEQLLGWSES
jgi:transcriptional regulator with GAF, ATPase, and Fis domain